VTDAARKILDSLDALPEADRREVFREILRRVALIEHGALSDADLVAAADEVFLEIERDENR
jgi:hypothetical protein